MLQYFRDKNHTQEKEEIEKKIMKITPISAHVLRERFASFSLA
jgi:hypothetical protein